MNEKENSLNVLRTLTNNKNEINHVTNKMITKEINNKEKHSTSPQAGLKILNNNVNRMESIQDENKTLKEKKDVRLKQVEELPFKDQNEDKINERLPEVFRRSPPSLDNNILDLPLFVHHEKETKIHIHHKETKPLLMSNIVSEDNNVQKLQLQTKKLENQINIAEKENEEKTKKLVAIRKEIHIKEKELSERKAQTMEIKARIQSLDDQIEEQNEYFKELSSIIYGINEKGLKHQEAMQQKEDEINDLLNRLSETNYKIMELTE
ncbi:uncharacterized protein BX663DRAFT_447469 [Cokeromyces recurvatus]|uniref:uncharacterized protein n=1 Tax=Cokeromyces recurvatus TaxID=90255 RepID=UPI00221FDEEC|nr:uncharacterized protein BX663DRAFT_447469 [Cokeromyces recurvatus]KAI7907310.1 hypothetical protein BX663DRAFT_447469 [Cokeromyces recurvatus]